MPIRIEILTRIVVSLIITVASISAGIILVTIHRRISRRRFFEHLDAERKRAEALLEPVYRGQSDLIATIESVKASRSNAERRAFEEVLLRHTQVPKEIAVTRSIVQQLGWMQEWIEVLRCRAATPSGEIARLLRESGDDYHPPRGLRRLRLRLQADSVARCTAAAKLARIPTPAGMRALIAAATDPHRDVREICFRQLGNLADPPTLPVLLEELVQVIEGTSPLPVRDIKTALTHFPLREVSAFRPALEHPHPRVRFFAVDAIREIIERHPATQFLGKNDFSPEIYRLFTERLCQDKSDDVRARAAAVVPRFHDRASFPTLEKLLQDEVWFVRMHTCRAVDSKFYLPLAPSLAKRLSDSHWLVREAAARSLCKMGEPGVEHTIGVFLGSQDEYIAEQISEELQRSGILFDILADVSDPVRRQRALRVILRMVSMQKKSILHSSLLMSVPSDVKLIVMEGLGACSCPECRRVFERLAKEDPNPAVREAALDALHGEWDRARSNMAAQVS